MRTVGFELRRSTDDSAGCRESPGSTTDKATRLLLPLGAEASAHRGAKAESQLAIREVKDVPFLSKSTEPPDLSTGPLGRR